MVSPTGVSRDVFGTWNIKVAREYVALWAPEKCSPEKRQELYGDLYTGNRGSRENREVT